MGRKLEVAVLTVLYAMDDAIYWVASKLPWTETYRWENK